ALNGRVLSGDASGNILGFDPAKYAALPGGGKAAATVLLHDPGRLPRLLVQDGQTAATALVGHGTEARGWKTDGAAPKPGPGPAPRAAALAGDPAVVGDTVVLPLAHGKLLRLQQGGAEGEEVWRSPDADRTSPGHAVGVGTKRVACTNGSRGLTLWRLGDKGLVRLKTAEVKNRILFAPAVLADAAARDGFGLAVADAGRVVTLFRGEELSKVREWTVSDDITTAPFVRA